MNGSSKKNSKKRASVRALGCRLNQYESLSMENRLKNKGYELVPFGEKAELGVINTCTVTNEADGKSRSVIRKFVRTCLLYTSPSPRDLSTSRMPSSA